MAKFKQECIFGIRAVMEAIQDEKEIDKVMFRQGIKGELFQQLFSLVRERQIQFSTYPEEVFKTVCREKSSRSFGRGFSNSLPRHKYGRWMLWWRKGKYH